MTARTEPLHAFQALKAARTCIPKENGALDAVHTNPGKGMISGDLGVEGVESFYETRAGEENNDLSPQGDGMRGEYFEDETSSRGPGERPLTTKHLYTTRRTMMADSNRNSQLTKVKLLFRAALLLIAS
ncbi:hypothetical protein cyc_06685 [Cyclospora cayetanensis]|uniref:Uncharacterized protein n=1 Tax=Cyclospora cayetanensis TaxID=88456 RepID=A0A1D3D033_9EIME|nr:hypothetical protein cyc_06685 [Cyclospora cayetanensis]